jgi:hypothetical protein
MIWVGHACRWCFRGSIFLLCLSLGRLGFYCAVLFFTPGVSSVFLSSFFRAGVMVTMCYGLYDTFVSWWQALCDVVKTEIYLGTDM